MKKLKKCDVLLLGLILGAGAMWGLFNSGREAGRREARVERRVAEHAADVHNDGPKPTPTSPQEEP